MEAQGSSLSSLQHQILAFLNSGANEKGGLQNKIQNEIKVYEQQKEYNARNDAQLREEMIDLSRKLREEMKKANTNIDFSYNDDIKSLVVTVREASGNRIIREIPSEEAIELVMKMRDMIGNIFDKRV